MNLGFLILSYSETVINSTKCRKKEPERFQHRFVEHRRTVVEAGGSNCLPKIFAEDKIRTNSSGRIGKMNF